MPVDPQVSLWAVFMLGVSLGLTACAVTCLPFIGTLVFGKAAGRRSGLLDTALFLGGRLFAYTLLGGLAGALGAWFVKVLAAGVGNVAIGLAAVFSAVLLFARNDLSGHAGCGQIGAIGNLSPFLLGVALTLIPCAPLATLLATAAAGEAIDRGALLGFMFGLGALLTPMLVLIPAGASIAGSLRGDQPWLAGILRNGAAMVLTLIGCRRIVTFSIELAVVAGVVSFGFGAWVIYQQRRNSCRKQAVQPLIFHR